MNAPQPAARDMFNKDLNDTFSRIQTRVKELHAQTAAEEEKERLEGEARVQLATQPDGTLALPVAEDGQGARRAQVFAGFPRSFQGTHVIAKNNHRSTFITRCGQDQ